MSLVQRAFAALLCVALSGCAGARPAATGEPAARVALAAAPDRFMTRGDARIRYRDSGGAGEPVVVLHGFTRDLTDWLVLGDSIALDHRVIAIDVRGHGKSSKPADASQYGRAMADDVIRVLDDLHIQRAHVAGHSMGALIASAVAVRYPQRVLSGTFVAGPFAADSATLADATQPWIREMESGAGLKNFFRWIFPLWPEQLAATVNAQVLKTNDVPALLAVMRSLGALAVTRGETQKSRVRVLIADGTGDPLLPQSRDLAARWPNARLLEVQGADHAGVIASPLVLAAMREVMSSSRKK
jgi:pimeloyl-ACP methyl ester carboxylesterase